MPDSPDPDLLAAIVADPNDGARWLALAEWFRDNDRDEEAAAVRVFWPQIRANLVVRGTLDGCLDDVRRSASILGACAREIERGRLG